MKTGDSTNRFTSKSLIHFPTGELLYFDTLSVATALRCFTRKSLKEPSSQSSKTNRSSWTGFCFADSNKHHFLVSKGHHRHTSIFNSRLQFAYRFIWLLFRLIVVQQLRNVFLSVGEAGFQPLVQLKLSIDVEFRKPCQSQIHFTTFTSMFKNKQEEVLEADTRFHVRYVSEMTILTSLDIS